MARTFDSSSKRARGGTAPGALSSTGTLAQWIRPHSAYNDGVMHCYLMITAPGGTYLFHVFKYSDNQTYVGWYPNGAGSRIIVSTNAWVQNDWNLLVYDWVSGGASHLFIAQKNATPSEITHLTTTTVFGGTPDSVTIGGSYSGDDRNADADMGGTCIWSKVLSESERNSLFAMANPNTISGRTFYYPMGGTASPETDAESSWPSLTLAGSPARYIPDIQDTMIEVSKGVGFSWLDVHADIQVSKAVAFSWLDVPGAAGGLLVGPSGLVGFNPLVGISRLVG